MLNNISWQGYWTTLALLTAAYYVVIYLVYFRKGFPTALSRTFHRNPSGLAFTAAVETAPAKTSVNEGTETEFTAPAENSEEALVYSLVDELSAYLQEARRIKTRKPELVYSLEKILSKYPALNTSPFKESITKVLVSEAEHICSVHLSEEDISKVWKCA